MIIIDTRLSKLPNETEEQYIWRLGQLKDSGAIDLTWDDITDYINRECDRTDNPYTEASYRKPYQQAKRFYEAGVFSKSEDSLTQELRYLKDEVYKEKRKLYDQRREYNKVLTDDARAEHLTAELTRCAEQLNKEQPLTFDTTLPLTTVNKVGLLALSDWHYALTTQNIWNTYNTDICRKRVKLLVELVTQYIKQNQLAELNIVLLGDFIHGAIHTGCRVKSSEDTCDQLIHVSELLAETINELSNAVPHITVYSCYGNHGRAVANKADSIHTDNMEKIIPWWIQQRLQNNTRVQVYESGFTEFTVLEIYGKYICCVHGDLDKQFKDIGMTINNLFTKKYGVPIDYTVSGDKHHLEEFEQFGIESILVRSLCGADDFSNEKRLYSRPGQTLMIFNDLYGREATYHIPLDFA